MIELRWFENIGPDYLWRYKLIPTLVWRGVLYCPPGNVFLHLIWRSDDDRALHDHPWASWSIKLWGELSEIYEDEFHLKLPHMNYTHTERSIPAFKIIRRTAEHQHRLIVRGDGPVVTLFFVGRKARSWGFWPNGKFVHWKEYLK